MTSLYYDRVATREALESQFYRLGQLGWIDRTLEGQWVITRSGEDAVLERDRYRDGTAGATSAFRDSDRAVTRDGLVGTSQVRRCGFGLRGSLRGLFGPGPSSWLQHSMLGIGWFQKSRWTVWRTLRTGWSPRPGVWTEVVSWGEEPFEERLAQVSGYPWVKPLDHVDGSMQPIRGDPRFEDPLVLHHAIERTLDAATFVAVSKTYRGQRTDQQYDAIARVVNNEFEGAHQSRERSPLHLETPLAGRLHIPYAIGSVEHFGAAVTVRT